MSNDKGTQKAISDGQLQAQKDASYINWLLMNEYTFEQAVQLFTINKMQDAMYEGFMKKMNGR